MSLHLSKCHIVENHMRWLISKFTSLECKFFITPPKYVVGNVSHSPVNNCIMTKFTFVRTLGPADSLPLKYNKNETMKINLLHRHHLEKGL